MRASVLILAAASGDVEIKDETDDNSSLYDVMQRYCTGTQKVKEWNRPTYLPTADELGPIVSHLPFESPEQKSKEMLDGGKQSGGKKKWSDFTEQIEKFSPDYFQTTLAVEQAEAVMKSKNLDGAHKFSLE